MGVWAKFGGKKKSGDDDQPSTRSNTGHLMEDSGAAEQLALLDQGFIVCDGCNSELEFEGVEPLSVVECPACERELFIPWDLGEWWITRPLRAGGFGLIYLGRKKSNPVKKVAVKVLKEQHGTSEQVREEFIRESEVCYTLGIHPHLPDTYAVGEEDGRMFIVQQFVNGRSFFDYFELEEHRPSEELALYYMVDLISALSHIHDCGYIHRDVKPENIMLTDGGMLVLLDFGGCRTFEEAKTCNQGMVAGSPKYMPPERYHQRTEDWRSDIYCLGLVAYFLMTGNNFAKGQDVRDLAHSHTKALRFSDAISVGGVSEEFNAIMSKMVRRKRQERHQDYGELFGEIAGLIMRFHKQETNDRVLRARRKHFLDNY